MPAAGREVAAVDVDRRAGDEARRGRVGEVDDRGRATSSTWPATGSGVCTGRSSPMPGVGITSGAMQLTRIMRGRRARARASCVRFATRGLHRAVDREAGRGAVRLDRRDVDDRAARLRASAAPTARTKFVTLVKFSRTARPGPCRSRRGSRRGSPPPALFTSTSTRPSSPATVPTKASHRVAVADVEHGRRRRGGPAASISAARRVEVRRRRGRRSRRRRRSGRARRRSPRRCPTAAPVTTATRPVEQGRRRGRAARPAEASGAYRLTATSGLARRSDVDGRRHAWAIRSKARTCSSPAASSGIGAALAEGFAERGRDRRHLRPARRPARRGARARAGSTRPSRGAGRSTSPTSTARRRSRRRSSDELGGIDVLVNNAGIPKRRDVTTLDARDRRVGDGASTTSRPSASRSRCSPSSIERGGPDREHLVGRGAARPAGRGRVRGVEGRDHRRGRSRCRSTWRDTDVQVHVVNPGVIDTELFHLPDNDELRSPASRRCPVEAMVEPVLDAARRRARSRSTSPTGSPTSSRASSPTPSAFLDGHEGVRALATA